MTITYQGAAQMCRHVGQTSRLVGLDSASVGQTVTKGKDDSYFLKHNGTYAHL